MLLIKNPIAQFFTLDGDPLDNGSVYIGTPGLNPETNPIAIYWDRDGLIPAAQPVKTSRGYISNNGTPARIYINDLDYSVNVRDKNGVLIYSSLSVTGETIGALSGSSGASNIGYDNATSGLSATDVQDAIDELTATPAVLKSGDTMTGPLSVPSGAAGAQVPQAQEVVGKTSTTGSAKMPNGTTAQRDGSPAIGYTRWNTTLGCNETWSGTDWVQEGIVESAVVATTSGTGHEIAGIPAWPKRIVMHLVNVSTSGSQYVLARIGNTSLATSGYLGTTIDVNAAVETTSTSGMPMRMASSANNITGTIEIVREPGTFNYKMTSVIRRVDTAGSGMISHALVTLTGALDRVGLARQGSDTFDGGKFWVTWEN